MSGAESAAFLDDGDRRRWRALVTLLAVDGVWLWTAGIGVKAADLLRMAEGAGALAALAAVVWKLSRVPRLAKTAERLRYPGAAAALHAALQILVFAYGLETLSYLALTMGAPLADEGLARADAALGFDWRTAFDWVRARPGLQRTLLAAYRSGLAQLIAVPAILGVLGRRERLGEFLDHFMAAGIVTLAIAAPFPAQSPILALGLDGDAHLPAMTHFNALRNGTIGTLPLARMEGLITFPSFHTAMAALLAWALRGVPYLFPASLVLNALMIASTPTEGGHYLVDTLAGLVIAALVVWGRPIVLQTAAAASKRRGESGGRRR